MPVSHGPFGISEAQVRAELDRRQAEHARRLKAAQERLTKVRRANAALTRKLSLVQVEIDQVRTEEQALMDQAAAAYEQRGNLVAALADQFREEAARQQQGLAQLKRRLTQYRSLRAQLVAGVIALIHPFLRERSRKEGAHHV